MPKFSSVYLAGPAVESAGFIAVGDTVAVLANVLLLSGVINLQEERTKGCLDWTANVIT
jgi:hypothetical protein